MSDPKQNSDDSEANNSRKMQPRTDVKGTDRELQRVALQELIKSIQESAIASTPAAAVHDWKFWKTQPVPMAALDLESCAPGPILPPVPVSEIGSELKLPAGYEWCTVDMTEADQVVSVYELLSANYVEDTAAKFRFAYTADFLKWALMPPGIYFFYFYFLSSS